MNPAVPGLQRTRTGSTPSGGGGIGIYATRLTNVGALDTSFGNAGFVTNSNFQVSSSAVLASNGDLLLSGTPPTHADFAVAAIAPNGNNGIDATTPSGSRSMTANDSTSLLSLPVHQPMPPSELGHPTEATPLSTTHVVDHLFAAGELDWAQLLAIEESNWKPW
jgi:hypothetical protein